MQQDFMFTSEAVTAGHPLHNPRKISMSAMHYHLNEDFVASDVVRWYNKATLGAKAVIAFPPHPSVWLHCCPNEHVYWYTEGGRGMTVSLEDARQRLAMFQTRWRVAF